MLWGGKEASHSRVVGRARDALQEWNWAHAARLVSEQNQSTNQIATSTAWEPPPLGSLKCNMERLFGQGHVKTFPA